MRERLNALIRDHGSKHWQFAVKKDAGFMEWIAEQTIDLPTDTPFSTRVYCAAMATRPECPRGSARKLKNIIDGWFFCGPTGRCLCAREQVSASVKAKKALLTDGQKLQTQLQREQTNLSKYGHRNTGQTEFARSRHAEFYADPENVDSQNSKVREAMLAKYGVANGFNTEKANVSRRQPHSPDSVTRGVTKRALLAQDGALLAKSHPKLVARIAKLGFQMLTPLSEYKGLYGHQYYEFVCDRCRQRFSDYLFASHNPTCPLCDVTRPQYVSDQEIELAEYVTSLRPGVIIRNTKKHIRGREIDLYLPDSRIAIEYCGLYWHDERHRREPYHKHKLDLCLRKGIRLITLFSDEWLLKRTICEERLRHILRCSTERIYARETEIVGDVSSQEARQFLDRFHIQGCGNSASVNIGLYCDDTMMALMTFGRPRFLNGGAATGAWELLRFANAGLDVVGGASRLFTYFIRQYKPERVISYCDRRWGEGEVYQKMGFAKVATTKPGYFWIEDSKIRHSRSKFTKDKLIEQGCDAKLTEVQIMHDRKFWRIWDCGHHRFEWFRG